MNYYYIISTHYVDFYNILFADLKNEDQAFFKDNDHIFHMNRYLLFLEKHWDYSLIGISFIRWLESFYFRRYFRKLFEGVPDNISNKYCFVIPSYIINLGADEYIRKHYQGSKIVCLCTDLLETHYEDMLLLKNPEKVDIFYSYDSGEAGKYHMRFINLPCSDFTPYTADVKQEYDLSFVGQDKSRLADLAHICENLRSRGFTCNFHLVKVPEEKQIHMEGMHYHDDYLSFVDCLKISASGKCILELIQPGSQGNTTRVAESISIGRKLLSVNPQLARNEYYIPENMLCFREIENVSDEFFLKGYQEISEEARNRIRPKTFIEHIEHDLNELDNLRKVKC